jgi:hypothetical protein
LRIEFNGESEVKKIAARVVKSNGVSVELTKADFHESTVAKQAHKDDLKQIAFAFPNLEPGDIVEYRWVEAADSWITFWFFCQQELPISEFKFVMDAANGAVISWGHCTHAEPTGAGTEHPGVTIHNLPAFLAEPYMPPENDVRGWIRLLYDRSDDSIEKRWRKFGEDWARFFSEHTEPHGALKKKAAELVAGASSDEEKLRRIYNFCQNDIVNYTWNDSPEILREKEKLEKKSFQTARQTLESQKGNFQEVAYLFAGLARAAGFEVREGHNASRDKMLNIKFPEAWNSMDNMTVAVKLGDRWRFYNPGHYFVPFGMNQQEDEGTTAFVADRKESFFMMVPPSPAENSEIKRKGRFQLDADGTLEGDVEETFTGHRAESVKEQDWQTPPADMDKRLRARVVKRLPTAEISEIRWENLRMRGLPVILHYKVQVPGYAQQVGQRLILIVNYFEAGSSPTFPAPERHFPILFPYAWKEHDDVEIGFPEGFELDQSTAPRPAGRAEDPIHATFAVRYFIQHRTLIYERDFVLGENGQLAYPVESYPWFKQAFDRLHQSESHTLVLKPKHTPADSNKPTGNTKTAASPEQSSASTTR